LYLQKTFIRNYPTSGKRRKITNFISGPNFVDESRLNMADSGIYLYNHIAFYQSTKAFSLVIGIRIICFAARIPVVKAMSA
jgi:hypothetical protein